MNKLLIKLNDWGCDIDGAMNRLLDDEELYITCLDSLLSDSNFEALAVAIKDNDVNAAFECAHTLKGVLGNMGITPMYQLMSSIVEPLRIGKFDNVLENYEMLMKDKAYLQKLYDEQ
ncbi:MAG: Hpt domain-containing protein [Erysipelotrichaceae bacterium]